MMTEAEIRDFLRGTTHNAMKLAVYERIIVRWLADREEAEQAGKDAVYDDMQDGWHGGEG